MARRKLSLRHSAEPIPIARGACGRNQTSWHVAHDANSGLPIRGPIQGSFSASATDRSICTAEPLSQSHAGTRTLPSIATWALPDGVRLAGRVEGFRRSITEGGPSLLQAEPVLNRAKPGWSASGDTPLNTPGPAQCERIPSLLRDLGQVWTDLVAPDPWSVANAKDTPPSIDLTVTRLICLFMIWWSHIVARS
jgi:hypothetical protein